MAASDTETDWIDVKARVTAGESYRSIASDHKASHVSIMRRAKKEGWCNRVAETKAVAMLEKQLPTQRRDSRNTPANLLKICDLIRVGMSPTNAAACAGLAPATLTGYRESPKYNAAIVEAQLASLGQAENSIYDAHERGDWKAAVARLQFNPLTREQYAGQDKQDRGITVVINVNRDQQVSIEQPSSNVKGQ